MIASAQDGWFQVLGRAHPLVMHLPIGLWVGIFLLEFGGALVRRPAPRATVVALCWIAALGGCIAAATGWIWALEGDHSAEALDRHRWLGVAVAAVGILAALLSCFRGRQAFRLLLLVVLGVLVPAGHLGSELTHGKGFLLDPVMREPAPPPAPAEAAATPDTGPPPARSFATAITPILARTCTKCHNPSKHKGDLVLETVAGIQKGGKDGPALVPGDAAASEMVRRLRLPLDDEDHMPPEAKPQPTADEIAALADWIAAGAPFEGSWGPEPKTPVPADAIVAPDQPAKGATPTGAQPAPNATGQPPGETPTPETRRGGSGSDEDAGADAAVAALRARLVHVSQALPGSDGLWIDFAAIAPGLTDAEATALLAPVAPRVVDLGLARAPVGDETLAVCAKMPRLARLDLRATKVTSKGLQHLAALPELRDLVLAQTHLDDLAVDPLLAMPALQRVYVWDCGIGAEGLARLRARNGLHVDAGDAPPAAPLETEGELHFTNELPPPGQEAPPAAVAAALKPVNDVCPVSGKPVDPRYVIVHQGRAVGFCCPNCPAAFWASPEKYAVAAR